MTQPAGANERPLSRRERALLDFERDWREHEGRKGEAVRERFGISQARYYQLLNRLLASPAALAYDPLLVLRLRRRREARAQRRAAEGIGHPGP